MSTARKPPKSQPALVVLWDRTRADERKFRGVDIDRVHHKLGKVRATHRKALSRQ